MMALILKTLRDKRWVMLGWAVGIIAISALTISFFPSFSQGDTAEAIVKSLPPQFQSIFGDALSFKQVPNFVSQQVFDFRLPLFMIILAVVMAVNLTVSEEEAGLLKTLQTLPISRTKVVLAKWLGLAVITAVVCAAALPGVLLGVALIGETISFSGVALAVFMLWLLTLSVASLTLMIGFVSGKKGLTVGIASLLGFANIFLSTLAPSVKDLQGVYKWTLYYYYNNPKPIVDPFDWAHVAILATAAIVFMMVAVLFYRKRDIEGA